MSRPHASVRPFAGIDANERSFGNVRNALVAVVLDGVAGVSPEHPGHGHRQVSPEQADQYIDRGRQVLADFEAQAMAPGGARGHAQKWMDRHIDELRRLVGDAEKVRAGKKAQKMTPESYSELRKSLGVGESMRAPVTRAQETVREQPWVPPSFSSEGITPIMLEVILHGMGEHGGRIPRPGDSFIYDRDGYARLLNDGYIVLKRKTPGLSSLGDYYVLTDKGADLERRYRLEVRKIATPSTAKGRTREAPYQTPKPPSRHFVSPMVADFNTLDDLIEHARGEGATHVLHVDDEVHLYFQRRDGQYEKAEVWQKDGYWHTQGPGSRVIVRRPPSNAQAIGGRRAVSEARRPRTARLTLGRDGMGSEADEVDFDAWVSYVSARIDERTGLDVAVDERGPRDVQDDAIRANSEQDEQTIREALHALWEDFSADTSAWPTRGVRETSRSAHRPPTRR